MSSGLQTFRESDGRVNTIDFLAFDPQYAEVLLQVAMNKDAGADSPLAMRVRAVTGLSRTAGPDAFRKLLANWSRDSATFRRALLDALLARPERVAVLLDELASGNVRVSELESSYVNRLLKQGQVDLRQRAEKLLASAIPARFCARFT